MDCANSRSSERANVEKLITSTPLTASGVLLLLSILTFVIGYLYLVYINRKAIDRPFLFPGQVLITRFVLLVLL